MRTLRDRRDAAGFTLVELLVTMLVGGILASIGGAAVFNWTRTARHQGSSQQLTSELRQAAVRAVSEGRTYCIDLTSTTYQVWRKECGSAGAAAGGVRATQSSNVTIVSTVTLPSPTPACPSGHKCVYFYPRGTATPATLEVRSSVRSKVYTIHVEGLTSRVY